MVDGKAIWKPGIAEIVKASRYFAPEPHKGGLHTLGCDWHTLGYGLWP